MNLNAHYTSVAVELLKLSSQEGADKDGCRAAANFIEGRLMKPEVHEAFDRLERAHQEDYALSEQIKKDGKMSLVVDDKGGYAHVTVKLDSSVSQQQAERFFNLSNAIYDTLFGGLMTDQKQNTRSTPRTMEFNASGELRALFVAWQKHKELTQGKQAG
ncbi:MAG: hypothetical protein ACN2B6_06130 [Rickettsiales bacterium]